MKYQEIIKAYPEHKEKMEEYAGKQEFDNELTRENAEAETALMMHERHLLFPKGNLFYKGSKGR